jgi:hypothetical protein
MTKKSALLVLALVGSMGLTIGCKGNSSGIGKTSPSTSPSTLDSRDAGAVSTIDAESVRALVGHWRNTTVMFENTKDAHLVLDANGAATTWDVTVSSRSRTTSGTWSVEGKNLTLRLEGNVVSSPFTIYQGQLVFPNIPNKRGFWEKIDQ